MCDIATDMPEVVRDGPMGVLAMESGLCGLEETACKLLSCLSFLSSSASNCAHSHWISFERCLLSCKDLMTPDGCLRKCGDTIGHDQAQHKERLEHSPASRGFAQ